MLSRGDAVVYKCRGMYKVEEIGTLDFSFADSKKKYYTLQSIEDAKDKAYVPTDDEKNIRRPVSFEEAKHLLDCVDKIEVLSVKNEKFREQEYKDCISDFKPENWVRVLRTLYTRTKRRGSMTSMDKKYQMLLEHALYSEMQYVLGISAALHPMVFQMENIIDIIVLVVMSAIVLCFAWTKQKLVRWEGAVMLAMYAGYVVYICLR